MSKTTSPTATTAMITTHIAAARAKGQALVLQVPTEGGLVATQAAAVLLGLRFRAPHHSVRAAGMLSEVARAAGGVLFIDAAGLFQARSIDALVRVWEGMDLAVRPVIIWRHAPGPHDIGPEGDPWPKDWAPYMLNTHYLPSE